MIVASKLLGVGIYSIADAAFYARVPTQTLNRWLYGNKQGENVIAPRFGEPEDKFLTFLDFVQALAIRRIRQERRVPLHKIREAYFRARKEFGVEYPLALDSARIGLFGPPNNPSRQEVYICLNKDESETASYFQLTGKKHGNQLIGEVVTTYSRRLTYDESGLAKRYEAFKTDDETFVMDPAIRFGEPYSTRSGYTAQTLFDAYQSEGSIQRAAEVYGVDPLTVEAAVEYFDYLKPPSAA